MYIRTQRALDVGVSGKCELHKCRAIKKAMDDILDNIKVIKDVLKCKRG